jgi:hypothetical protein
LKRDVEKDVGGSDEEGISARRLDFVGGFDEGGELFLAF